MTRRIAIIGSGMAGLAASWFLGAEHEVTLFERHDTLGIGAHSVQAPGGVVDVPLRVIYPGYYPELFALLAQTGVPVEPLDASLGFSELGGESYFRYRNYMALGKTVPWVAPSALLRDAPRHILLDLGRFLLHAPRALANGTLDRRTLGEYLTDEGYSAVFADRFLVPIFAGINTVSCQAVRDYPAAVIAQYFNRDFIVSSVYRAAGGAQAIARALSGRVARQRLGARIRAVRREGDAVTITMEDGRVETFDTVVFATQANQILDLLEDASRAERALFKSVRYDKVRVVMHTDASLMPAHRRDWGPVNYVLSPAFDRPMVSIWVNRLLPSYQHDQPLFQTINPMREPAPEMVLKDCNLQRPLVGVTTQATLQKLQNLHAQTRRRVFFCGSYAAPGIPLLESAVASALAVSRAIGVHQLDT